MSGGAGLVTPHTSTGTVIPYDYAATFKLRGIPGNLVQDVINVSVEGVFVAVGIGYGFEEERGRPIEGLLNAPSGAFDFTLGQLPADALIAGVRTLTSDFATIFQRVKPPEDITFLFSIVDSGTGRELQDEPTHNLASLGKSNGERPFRLLPQPLSFAPRSTIRLQIIERSEGLQGTVFIVLYGYKILGAAGCPEPVVRSLRGGPLCPTETLGSPSDRIIPFDYVATFQLTGRPGNLVEDEVSINVEGGFVATAIGYGLAVGEQTVPIQVGAEAGTIDGQLSDVTGSPLPGQTITFRNIATRSLHPVTTDSTTGQFNSSLPPGEYHVLLAKLDLPKPPKTRVFGRLTTALRLVQNAASNPEIEQATIDLASFRLKLLSSDVLADGFRIRPGLIRLAFQDGGRLTDQLQVDLMDKLFERLNRPEDVSFLYSIFDTGTGRELQNQPIHNIAGLGIANGDRPFKKFARPMVFLPRSTIRVRVEERFGRGRLFLVFQGYKILGGSRLGRRA